MRRRNAFFLALALGACAPEGAPTVAVNQAEVERLFDDALEPPTVGITLGAYEARDDASVQARASLSEAIVRAQVTSILPIAPPPGASSGGWFVELSTRDVLRGGPSTPSAFEVEAPPGSRTASLVENFRPNFERAHVLVFARRFARPGQRIVWHVHTMADTSEVREVVSRTTP